MPSEYELCLNPDYKHEYVLNNTEQQDDKDSQICFNLTLKNHDDISHNKENKTNISNKEKAALSILNNVWLFAMNILTVIIIDKIKSLGR